MGDVEILQILDGLNDTDPCSLGFKNIGWVWNFFMAKFSSTTFGLMSGKYGTAVATARNGKNLLRPYNPDSYKRVASEAMLAHRMKFAIVMKELNKFRGVINRGYSGKGAFSSVTKFMLKNGVSGTYPEFLFNYNQLQLTSGKLQSVESASASKDEMANEVQIDWDTTLGLQSDEGAMADKVSLIFFNEDTKLCIIKDEVADREVGSYSEVLPEVWGGAIIHCWLFLTSEDGLISNSKYLGSVTN